jgi:uncharacterized Zn finger protein (UPF0148 family)
MSGFDEEAERERLREKYEQDQGKRAATQRMSELLLKGATMTNAHCDACGDPIFRHDGQEFCPTCQAPETDAEADDADGSPPADAAGTDDADVRSTPTADESTRPQRRPPNAGATPTHDHRGAGDPAAAGRDDRSADASLDDAPASLTRTLVRYARAAEGADDPRRAEELLAAARGAAEALSALDRR